MPNPRLRSIRLPLAHRAPPVVSWSVVLVCLGALALMSLFAAPRAGAQGGAVVRIDPASSSVQCGVTTVVDVRIENVSNLAGAEVHLTYDPFLLDAQIQPGGFPAPDYVLQSSATGGRIDFAITQMPPHAPVSGSGVLLKITFRGLAPGVSAIDFTSALLSDGNGILIPSTTQNGSVSVCPTPTPTFTPTHTPTPTHTSTPTPTTTSTPTSTPTTTSGSAKALVSPPSSTLIVSNSTTVAIRIEGATNLWGVDLKLTYDPAIVECTGSLPGVIPKPSVLAKNSCGAGAAEYIAAQQAPDPPASGSGDAVRLTFKCLKEGTSPLHLERSKLVDRDGRDLPNTATHGQITCTPPPDDGSILGYHKVRAGETLYCIGRAYRVNPWAIATVNHIAYPYYVYPGQMLAIPNAPWTNIPPGPTCAAQFPIAPPPDTGTPPPPPPPAGCRAVYVVKPGDTLYKIAGMYGSDPWTIAARNYIYNLNLIYPGQRLCIP